MNIHKNARLTLARRIELVMDIVDRKRTLCAAAAASGSDRGDGAKVAGALLAGGEAALADRSSRPHRSPRSIRGHRPGHRRVAPATPDQGRIAASLGVSEQHGQPGARAGRPEATERPGSREPVPPLRARRPGRSAAHRHQEAGAHRATGPSRHRRSRDSVEAPAGSTCSWPSTTTPGSASPRCTPTNEAPAPMQFLRKAYAYYARLGVRQGGAHRQRQASSAPTPSARACAELGLRQRFTRAYRPQTNGKAERFIQSALREWAYAFDLPATRANAPTPWRPGCTTTTGTAHIRASAASPPWPDSKRQETTS